MLKKLKAQPWYEVVTVDNGNNQFAYKNGRITGWSVPGIHDIEHYRFKAIVIPHDGWKYDELPKKETYLHCGVLIADDGDIYTGLALPSFYDQYNRKLGFAIAMGRALSAYELHFSISSLELPLPKGVALRDVCRRVVLPLLADMDYPVVEPDNARFENEKVPTESGVASPSLSNNSPVC